MPCARASRPSSRAPRRSLTRPDSCRSRVAGRLLTGRERSPTPPRLCTAVIVLARSADWVRISCRHRQVFDGALAGAPNSGGGCRGASSVGTAAAATPCLPETVAVSEQKLNTLARDRQGTREPARRVKRRAKSLFSILSAAMPVRKCLKWLTFYRSAARVPNLAGRQGFHGLAASSVCGVLRIVAKRRAFCPLARNTFASVRVRLPAVSGFAGSMSLKMSLAASVFRASRVGSSPKSSLFPNTVRVTPPVTNCQGCRLYT